MRGSRCDQAERGARRSGRAEELVGEGFAAVPLSAACSVGPAIDRLHRASSRFGFASLRGRRPRFRREVQVPGSPQDPLLPRER